jgi:hypothetical protein
LQIVGFEQLREGAAGRDRPDVTHEQDVADICAPNKDVAFDVPAVKRFADRGENFAGVEADDGLRRGDGLASRAIPVNPPDGVRILRNSEISKAN